MSNVSQNVELVVIKLLVKLNLEYASDSEFQFATEAHGVLSGDRWKLTGDSCQVGGKGEKKVQTGQ